MNNVQKAIAHAFDSFQFKIANVITEIEYSII